MCDPRICQAWRLLLFLGLSNDMKTFFENSLIKILISLVITGTLFTVLLVKLNVNLANFSWGKVSDKRTELFFTNHLSLPKSIVVGESYNFEFTTYNSEGESLAYDYEVYIEANERTSEIEKGNFAIGHNEAKTIPVTFILSSNFGRGRISVRLINKNQQVSFWVEENN